MVCKIVRHRTDAQPSRGAVLSVAAMRIPYKQQRTAWRCWEDVIPATGGDRLCGDADRLFQRT